MAADEVHHTDGAVVRADPLTAEQRSRNMRAIRRRDTKPELRLRKALWAAGIRGYRCDARGLPGRPDVAFTRWKVAIFVDGTFWHGHPSAFPREGLSDYWTTKIRGNMERDRATDRALAAAGWRVLRLWDSQVRRDLNGCVDQVEDCLRQSASQRGRTG